MVQPYDRDKVVGKVSALIERERESMKRGGVIENGPAGSFVRTVIEI
jgi:hypothetical protein